MEDTVTLTQFELELSSIRKLSYIIISCVVVTKLLSFNQAAGAKTATLIKNTICKSN